MAFRENSDMQPQKAQLPDQQTEAVSGAGEEGVADRTGEIVAAYAMLGPEMADDRLDGGAPSHLSLDAGDAAPGILAPKSDQRAGIPKSTLWAQYATSRKLVTATKVRQTPVRTQLPRLTL